MRRIRGDCSRVLTAYQRESGLSGWYLRQSQAISISTRLAQALPAFEIPWQRVVEPLS